MKKIMSVLTVKMLILTGCVSQKTHETKIIAHKGAHIAAPENTVEVIEKANDLVIQV